MCGLRRMAATPCSKPRQNCLRWLIKSSSKSPIHFVQSPEQDKFVPQMNYSYAPQAVARGQSAAYNHTSCPRFHQPIFGLTKSGIELYGNVNPLNRREDSN